MNKPLNLIAIFFACSTASCPSIANAQTNQSSAYGPYRYTGGWNVSQSQSPDRIARAQDDRSDEQLSAVMQAAFYQSPDSGLGLPAYPGGDGSTAINDYPSENGNAAPLPLPNGLSSSMPSAMPSSMPNALSSGQMNGMLGGPSNLDRPNNMPAENYQPNNQVYPPNNQFSEPQPQFDAYAREQQQVLPPSQMQSPYRSASTDLRAVQNNQQYQAQPNPGNDLRPVTPMMQNGFGPGARQIEVATGYPFVSPAPRTGNYPTSQYNSALFRQVSYQNVVQSPQAPLSAAVANTQPTLPQYQNPPVAGVYPTQTQYQCSPGAPVYPPPGAVPGAYVPPTLTPNLTPGTYSPNNSGYSPVFSLGQENYNVQIGRGIIGQPTVYVPGQPFRNFIRYLSP